MKESEAKFTFVCPVTLPAAICERNSSSRGQLKCDGTRAENRFRLSAKRTGSFKSAGASVQSTTGSRRVHISGSNAGYTKFRGSVKSTGYPLHSPVSPSFSLLCVTVCHHISTGLYEMQLLYCRFISFCLIAICRCVVRLFSFFFFRHYKFIL
jgi:hypothetical protein